MSYMKRLYLQNLEDYQDLKHALEELKNELDYLEHEAYSLDNRIKEVQSLIASLSYQLQLMEATNVK